MNHDVATGQHRSPVVVESEAVGGHVAGDGRQPFGHHRFEPVTELLAEPVEAVVAENLPADPVSGGLPAARTHQHDDPAARHRPEQPLNQGGTQEAGGAGDGDALAGQAVSDHGPLSTIW